MGLNKSDRSISDLGVGKQVEKNMDHDMDTGFI